MGTGDVLLRVTLRWTSIPLRGGVAILSVAHAAETGDTLRPVWAFCSSCATFPHMTYSSSVSQFSVWESGWDSRIGLKVYLVSRNAIKLLFLSC